jgi:hypothetical protein
LSAGQIILPPRSNANRAGILYDPEHADKKLFTDVEIPTASHVAVLLMDPLSVTACPLLRTWKNASPDLASVTSSVPPVI